MDKQKLYEVVEEIVNSVPNKFVLNPYYMQNFAECRALERLPSEQHLEAFRIIGAMVGRNVSHIG